MDPPVLTGGLLPLLEIALKEDVRLTITAVGDNLRYQWQKDGTNIAGANSATHNLYRMTWSKEGEYRCIVSNIAGMVVSNAANVTGKGCLYKQCLQPSLLYSYSYILNSKHQ